MSFFSNIFGGAPAPAAAPAAPGPTNNLANNAAPAPPANSAVTAPNGTVPPEGNKAADQSPTEKFKDLWDPVKTEDGKPGDKPQGLTPEQMLEAASKVDFRKVLDQESLAKIKAGGDEAVGALADLLNKTGQSVYGQGLVVTQKLIEKAVSEAREDFQKQLPQYVRGAAARDSLIKDNAAFKDPAVAPVVEAIQSQLQAKFPNATADELSEMARDYFKAASGVLTSDPKSKTTAPKKSNSDDWEEWITTPIGSGE